MKKHTASRPNKVHSTQPQTYPVLGFVYSTRFSVEKVYQDSGKKVSHFPDLSGDYVIFVGVDTWVWSVMKQKFSKKALVLDIPGFFERLDIPVSDGIYDGRGRWFKRPISASLELGNCVLRRNRIVNRVVIDNAKSLDKLIQENPRLLKSKAFHKDSTKLVNERQLEVQRLREETTLKAAAQPEVNIPEQGN